MRKLPGPHIKLIRELEIKKVVVGPPPNFGVELSVAGKSCGPSIFLVQRQDLSSLALSNLIDFPGTTVRLTFETLKLPFDDQGLVCFRQSTMDYRVAGIEETTILKPLYGARPQEMFRNTVRTLRLIETLAGNHDDAKFFNLNLSESEYNRCIKLKEYQIFVFNFTLLK